MERRASEPDSAGYRGECQKTRCPIHEQRQQVIEDVIINREPAQ